MHYRNALAVLAAAIVSGCATFDVPLDNRVTCTVAKDKAFVVSEWGPAGISSRIADADRKEICK